MRADILAFLKKYHACQEGYASVKACKTWKAWWDSIDRPDWMLWRLGRGPGAVARAPIFAKLAKKWAAARAEAEAACWAAEAAGWAAEAACWAAAEAGRAAAAAGWAAARKSQCADIRAAFPEFKGTPRE